MITEKTVIYWYIQIIFSSKINTVGPQLSEPRLSESSEIQIA